MKLVKDTISIDELKEMSEKMFSRIVKAVVDINHEIIAVDAEMHVDLEAFLLENDSEQQYLWGINFHPGELNDKFVEFDSMINIRPSQNNRTRSVDDEHIRKKILKIVDRLVKP